MTGEVHAHVVIDGLGWGGAEMLLAHLATGADAAGLRLSVGYLFEKDGSPAAARLRATGIEPIRIPVDGLLSPRSLRSVRRHLAQVRPDVVHTHLGYSDMLAGVAARSLGIPSVSSIHLARWDSAGLRDHTKLVLAAAARRHCAAAVVAVSEAARGAYLERGWDRPRRVATIHNGISDAAVPGAGRKVREELGLSPADVVLAMVSVLRPGKGHLAAFRSLELLRRRHPHVQLLVLGDGPQRAELSARSGAGVRMLGHRDDVMAVLDAVDVLLHPSEHDAFPTSLLEAMSSSLPVVATRVGGIPEIVVDGVTGRLVEAPASDNGLAHALEPMVADAAVRRALGTAARERFLEHFTAIQWARRIRALYDEVLAARPPAVPDVRTGGR